jgi:hypothetical protein
LAVIGAAVLCVGLVVGTARLHGALGGSPETWAPAIQTTTTVVLAVVTTVYVQLTFALVREQHGAPRAAGRERGVRDLAQYIAANYQTMWTSARFFPVDATKRPPMVLDVIASRDGIAEVRKHLLEVLALVPREVAAPTLGAAAHLVDAEEEFHALAAALLDETQAALASVVG